MLEGPPNRSLFSLNNDVFSTKMAWKMRSVTMFSPAVGRLVGALIGRHQPQEDRVHEHDQHPAAGERVHVGGGVDTRHQLAGELRT